MKSCLILSSFFLVVSGSLIYAQQLPRPVQRFPQAPTSRIYHSPYTQTQKIQARRARTVSPIRRLPSSPNSVRTNNKDFVRGLNRPLDYSSWDRQTFTGIYRDSWKGTDTRVNYPTKGEINPFINSKY